MIKNIVHLSDIHIRNGDLVQSRFYSYLHAFDCTANEIKSRDYDVNELLIIITGDIFHVKNSADSTGIYLYNYLMHLLSPLCYKIILIYGNHDFKQHARDEPGILHSLTLHSDIENIMLLDETGHHVVKNVSFSLVAIKDTLVSNDTFGSHAVLPEFTNINKDNTEQTYIALFHGDIYSKERTEWLARSQCHAALLGDIHIPDINTITNIADYDDYHKFIYGYPGSLLQQNYGEDLLGHGFIIWNIAKHNVIIPQHVLLPAALEGFLNINNITEMAKIISSPYCPALLRVRTNISIEELVPYFGDKKYILERTSAIITDNDDVDVPVNKAKYFVSWNDYILERLQYKTDFSIKDYVILSDSPLISDKIKARNAKLKPMLKNIDDIITNNCKQELKIAELSFGWLFCYNNNNIIEFDDGTPIKIISGDNSTGKSSIFDIICLGLFAKQIESRKSDNYICSNMPLEQNAWIKIKLQNGFIISREFCISKQGKIDIKSKIIENNKIIKSGNPLVTEWTNINVGSYENFLLLGMISQNNDYSFFRMPSKEKIGVLDTMLGINNMYTYLLAIQESITAHDFIVKHLNTMKSIYEKSTSIKEIVNLSEMHQQLQDEQKWREEAIELNSDIKRLQETLREKQRVINNAVINNAVINNAVINCDDMIANMIMTEDEAECEIVSLKRAIKTKEMEVYARKEMELEKNSYTNRREGFPPQICTSSSSQSSSSSNIKDFTNVQSILNIIKDDTSCPDCIEIKQMLSVHVIARVTDSHVTDSHIIEHNKNEDGMNEDGMNEDGAKEQEIATLRQRLLLLKNYLISINIKKIEEELCNIDQTRNALLAKITPGLDSDYIRLVQLNERNKCINETAVKNVALIEEINEVIKSYITKIEVLEKINILSKGYREWLYQDIVLPNLCSEVNIMTSNLINTEWKLHAKIANNILNWTVSNGAISSGIATCGGYREFIFGISIRIAMAKYNNIKYKQLFIDEGFVAGSGLNLQEVPIFLDYITREYGISLILISHLSLLANCGKQIKITAEICPRTGAPSGISHINYKHDDNKHDDNNYYSINTPNKCNALLKSGKQCTAKQKIDGYCLRHYCKA